MPDINLNPFRSDRRLFTAGVATVATIKYGMAVIGDTLTTNASDVKLPAGAGAVGVRGIVADQGDPNNAGLFAVGDSFGICTDGYTEALLDAGQIATKDAPAITGATPGTIKPVGAEVAPYDIVGTFAQTFDNSGGAAPVLVSLRVPAVVRRFS
jgi:hypothetical protein